MEAQGRCSAIVSVSLQDVSGPFFFWVRMGSDSELPPVLPDLNRRSVQPYHVSVPPAVRRSPGYFAPFVPVHRAPVAFLVVFSRSLSFHLFFYRRSVPRSRPETRARRRKEVALVASLICDLTTLTSWTSLDAEGMGAFVTGSPHLLGQNRLPSFHTHPKWGAKEQVGWIAPPLFSVGFGPRC